MNLSGPQPKNTLAILYIYTSIIFSCNLYPNNETFIKTIQSQCKITESVLENNHSKVQIVFSLQSSKLDSNLLARKLQN
jgi:hypothetical protein